MTAPLQNRFIERSGISFGEDTRPGRKKSRPAKQHNVAANRRPYCV